jgi:hypothetical protein
VHQRLSRLIDGQEDQPAGKWLGGGGPVSDNVGNDGPGWPPVLSEDRPPVEHAPSEMGQALMAFAKRKEQPGSWTPRSSRDGASIPVDQLRHMLTRGDTCNCRVAMNLLAERGNV